MHEHESFSISPWAESLHSRAVDMGEHGESHWKIFKWERIEPVLGNDMHVSLT